MNRDLSDAQEDEPTGPVMRVPQPRVLVAEDDDHLRSMMAHRLRADGYLVMEAANGGEALDALDEASDLGLSVDLVVMDVRMPEMSGLDVGYLIRSWRWTTPIVIVTAYPDPELNEEVSRIGAMLLAKPFAFAKLSEVARDAVGGRTS